MRCCNAKTGQHAQVVVTREAGKNAKLKQALQDRSISVLELPLVETSIGPDRCGLCVTGITPRLLFVHTRLSRAACRDRLAAQLKDVSFDWVVITSPEAANVFLRGWIEANKPQARLTYATDCVTSPCESSLPRMSHGTCVLHSSPADRFESACR